MIQIEYKEYVYENDFDVVEEIVFIFEKYNIDAGGRHDF